MSERELPTDAEISELLAPLGKVIRDVLISTPVTLGSAVGIEELTARLALAVARYNSRILPPAEVWQRTEPAGDDGAAAARRRVTAAADWIAAHFSDRYAPWASVLAQATVDAGYAADDVEAARHALRLYYNGAQHLRVATGICVACRSVTAYKEPNHSLSLCRTCTTPIRLWEWNELREPRTPGKRRTRVAYSLSWRPGGWPANEPVPKVDGGILDHGRFKACGSTFDRARDGREMCAAVPVWRLTNTPGRRNTGVSYWCIDDLPAEHRPENTGAKLR